jgi:hypothetical protein
LRFDAELVESETKDRGVGLLHTMLEREHECIHEFKQGRFVEGGTKIEVDVTDHGDLQPAIIECPERLPHVVCEGIAVRIAFHFIEGIGEIRADSRGGEHPMVSLPVELRVAVQTRPRVLELRELRGTLEVVDDLPD